MVQQQVDGGFVRLRQLGKDALQLVDARPLAQVRVAVERVEQLRIILIGEERFRQVAQVRLEDPGHRVDVDLLQQLFRLVRVRLERLLQLGDVGRGPGHAIDADLGHAAPFHLPDARAHNEWNVSLFASAQNA